MFLAGGLLCKGLAIMRATLIAIKVMQSLSHIYRSIVVLHTLHLAFVVYVLTPSGHFEAKAPKCILSWHITL